MKEAISERRAAARFSLSLPATIYAGKVETHCRIKDFSRLGVAVSTLSGAPPYTVLRMEFSLRETGGSVVVCDCITVRNSSRPGNMCALRFLSPNRDLPANLEDFLAQSGSREPNRRSALGRRHTSRKAPEPGGNNQKQPYGARRLGLDKKLSDLYRRALESLDLE